MGTIDSVKSILTQSALDALCEKFYIPNTVHPELPGRNDRIRNCPLMNLYQLSVIAAAKVSHFEILCRVHDFVPTVEMDLFAFINHADPTKVHIGEREVAEGEVPLLQLTRGHVVPLAGVNDQGNVNVQGAGNDDVTEGDGDAAEANQTEQGEHVVDVRGIDVVADDEVQAIVADKPQRVRKKRKAADGASGSGLPPKKLREDHGTSSIGANTGGKFVAALQSILESSTLPVEVGVTATATMPFVTSSVTPDSIFGTVTSVIRSFMPPPPVLTAAVATTIIAGATSALVHESGAGQVRPSIFRDSASPSMAEADVVGPSYPIGTKLSAESFYVSQDMDPETLRQVYIPIWNVINDFVLDDPDVCRGMIDHLAPPGFFSQLRGMDYEQLLTEFNVGTARQVCFSAEIRMRLEHELREAVAAKAIRLHCQIANVEAAEAARLSCDELSVKASSLKFEKDRLVDQVSVLETTCSGIRDEVIGYKLFKEQVEAVQNEQVKALSDRVTGIDSDLMEMALHMDEEFYPRYLTTIARQRWILNRGLKLAIMKCLQSPEYLTALGGVIGRAIDKGMQDGLAAGIDHGKARRGLVDVSAYNPSAEADYVAAINALRVVDFPLLAQLESRKDASMADIMDLLRLEGLAAENPEASQLQPSLEQLMVPIHQLEDQVVIRETSLSFSLDVAHNRVQRIRGDVAACRLSLTDAMVPLIKPLFFKRLTGEASTSGVLGMATTTTLSTNFIQANTVAPTPSTEVPPSSKIVFEQEELDTTLEHTLAL
ncbi:hypothetical protein Tco_0313666 [Tanacetum coccineum]